MQFPTNTLGMAISLHLIHKFTVRNALITRIPIKMPKTMCCAQLRTNNGFHLQIPSDAVK